MFIDKLNGLLNKINTSLPELTSMYYNNKEQYNKLLAELTSLNLLIDSQYLWKKMESLYSENEQEKSNILRVMKSEKIFMLLGKNLEKPEGVDFEQYRHEVDIPHCNIDFSFNKLNTKDIKELTADDLTGDLEESPFLIIDGKIHSYRTYTPLISILIVGSEHNIYYVDLQCNRKLLKDLSLLISRKIILCTKSTYKIIEPMVNKYELFDSYTENSDLIYIDWRIRPLTPTLKRYMLEGFLSLLKCELKYNPEDTHCDFTKLNLSKDKRPLFNSIIKLRDLIARTNNESVAFVLTLNEIKEFILTQNVNRKSSLLRFHLKDFLFLFMQKNTTSAIERLKLPVEKEIDLPPLISSSSEEEEILKPSKYKNIKMDIDKGEFN